MRLELLGQLGGVGAALVPVLVRVGGEPAQDAGPLGRTGQRLLQAAGTDEAAHGLEVQVQAGGDRQIDWPWARSCWMWA
jgi:hypothetical protein